MKPKYILGLILILAVVGLVVYLTQRNSEEAVGATVSYTGVVTALDMSGALLDGPGLITIETTDSDTKVIAVPSMGLRQCIGVADITSPFEVRIGDTVSVVGEVNESKQVVPCQSRSHQLIVTTQQVNQIDGYSFLYTKAPTGYVLIENVSNPSPSLLSGLSLYKQKEYEQYVASSDIREIPPHMEVKVYAISSPVTPLAWAEANQSVSNIQLVMGDIDNIEIDGYTGIQYTADGLYPTNTVVAVRDTRVYVVTGSYDDPGDDIYADFSDLVASFKLLEATPGFYTSNFYKFSFHYPENYLVKEYVPEMIAVGERDGEIFNDVAEVQVLQSTRAGDYADFNSFLFETTQNACSADGPTGTMYCDSVADQQPFETASGLTGTTYYLNRTTEDYATGAKTTNRFGPIFAFAIEPNSPATTYAAIVVRPSTSATAAEVNSNTLQAIAESIVLN